ncbi:MAG TPA: GNAT family N-acetyltransferase [Anaerolineales bacterium]|nr:GNAT family N-acetyltransferase [Anaerolineales bacterium]
MSARVEPFTEAHLAVAAKILAARHALHREANRSLAPGDPTDFLRRAWQQPDVSGAVALEGRRVTAYLLAQIRDHPIFGRCAWVGHAGHASEDTELLRDVYAAAADAWANAGADRHYVLVPAFAAAIAPWYRLGFAHMHVEALRPLETEAVDPPDGVRLRRGSPSDLELAEEIDLEIYRIQERSPSFARLTVDRDARAAEWLELDLFEDGLRYLVAEENGRTVAHALNYRPDPVLGVPADAAHLASTAVLEPARGRGIGAAMLAEIMRLAAEAGYRHLVTNWRITNLSASRFWESRGFQPIYHRLHRTLGIG